MSTAALFSQQFPATQSLTGRPPAPMTGTASGSDSSASSTAGSGSATISANDFLTLLVTEMQNQDPTSQTDPNEYINQLVSVNSLEQLININQTLTGALGTASTSGSASTQAVSNEPATLTSGTTAGPASASAATAPAAQRTQGNLSVPAPSAAADRVAHALDGRTRSGPAVQGVK